ncbi:MAG: hypothetical protein IIZ78_23045 [Clostridiales bacterium]|nr:hypothetical protein [Clostridiales bacterium]
MGLPVLILGESGSGKTYSLKNFEPNEISIFSVEKSRLPFQKKLPIMPHATYEAINKVLRGDLTKKAYCIDDSQYLLVNQFFDGLYESNQFDLYKKIAYNFRNLIHDINFNLPDDVVVYFLHHLEKNNDGTMKAKTIGKMLDEKLTVEGCFDIVLYTKNELGNRTFVTQSDGFMTAKSPEGMFEKEIPNDLKAVDVAIRKYYGLTKTKNEEKKQ